MLAWCRDPINNYHLDLNAQSRNVFHYQRCLSVLPLLFLSSISFVCSETMFSLGFDSVLVARRVSSSVALRGICAR